MNTRITAFLIELSAVLDQITEGSLYGKRRGLKTDNAIYKLTTDILNAMNNELLVEGIFCDLEKAFDCFDHGIVLSKLNFYGISGKDHEIYESIWIIGILKQQCIMTVITVINFQAGSKLDMESHKAVFWDLYFFFYI